MIYDPVPEIWLESVGTVRSVKGTASLIRLVIGYQDGDGNIGLSDTDTAPPFNFGGLYYHNLPIEYQVKQQDGTYAEVVHPSTGAPYGNQHERVPPLYDRNIAKPISGKLTVLLEANPYGVTPESVRFRLALIDRDLNKSNTLLTDPLLLVH